jgi:hypothetical protein
LVERDRQGLLATHCLERRRTGPVERSATHRQYRRTPRLQDACMNRVAIGSVAGCEEQETSVSDQTFLSRNDCIHTALGEGARRRRGKVFSDGYHVEVITTPTRARHAISYILSNWRKHGEDRDGLPSTWLVDPFSSAIMFPDWQELEGQPWMWPIREGYDPLMVRRPQTWLLREGWKRAGGAISGRTVPSKPR